MTFSFPAAATMNATNYVLEITVGYDTFPFEMIVRDGIKTRMMDIQMAERFEGVDDNEKGGIFQ